MSELCLLSGLSPLGGPARLIGHEDLETVSKTIASEISSYGEVALSHQDLTSIVSSALELTLPPWEHRISYDRAPYLPEEVSNWDYFEPIGIGHFNSDIIGTCYREEGGRSPSGRDVQVRRLDQYDNYGYYYGVIVDDPDAPDGTGVRTEDIASYCGTGTEKKVNCNFFIMRGCLEYLRAWLDPSLPERIAFAETAPTMSLEGELYEIVNSRHGIRKYGSGLLSEIEYGDIEKTLEHYQNRFLQARNGSKYTGCAIKEGKTGEELLPAIFRDFQCWLSMRPDIWPSPADRTTTPKFTTFPTSSLYEGFNMLPTELFLDILSRLPISNILALSATSRGLRALITEPVFLNQVIRAVVLRGSAFWILPVRAIAGEEEQAETKAKEWLVSDAGEKPTVIGECGGGSVFHSGTFPYIEFVHACYESDSMRNRERLWKMVKQFDDVWRDYRVNGWQRDVFIH